MTDILLEMLARLFGGTALIVPILLLLLVIMGVTAIHRKVYHLPAYLLRAVITESICLFFVAVLKIVGAESGHAGLMEADPIAEKAMVGIGLLIIVMLCVMGLCIRKYLKISGVLRSALYHAQADHFEHNPILAWGEMDELKPSEMTQGQKARYERYRMYLRAKLGNFSANENELEKLEQGGRKQQAFCHFLRFTRCWSEGDMKTAAAHIMKAEQLCDADTDVMIRGQILMNRGVGYVGMGLYKDADDAFCRAIRYCRKHCVKDSGVWVTIYYNYVFNKTRLNPNIEQTECEQILEELKAHLDMEKPMDYLAFADIEMEMLRQTNADKKLLEDRIFYAFDYLKVINAPDANRCVFECSVARMIWAARLDPVYILEALTDDIDHLLQLPMPARYHSMKNIDLFFADLHGRIVEQHERLKQSAYWYMTNQAVQDLEEYRRGLPAEAVYERCNCFKEIAGLQKRRPDEYQWAVVKEQFENAMSLYHENGLELEEIMCKLALMDELTSPLNMDEHLKPKNKDEMMQLLTAVEAFLTKFEKHPAINEIALRLSFYCGIMDAYEKCMHFYELYRATSRLVSLNHYAPWMHKYYMTVCFMNRVFYALHAIEEIPRTAWFQEKDGLVRGWFEGFSERNGENESYILGRMLGYDNYVMLKRVVWTQTQTDAEADNSHVWMVIPEMGLEIDITYKYFAEDAERNTIFFCMNQHPMQSGESNFIRRKKQENPGINVIVQQGQIGLEQFSPAIQATMQEILRLLDENLSEQCPTVADLKQAYRDVMLPVSAV